MGEGAQRLPVAIETDLKETSVSCVGGLGKPRTLLVVTERSACPRLRRDSCEVIPRGLLGKLRRDLRVRWVGENDKLLDVRCEFELSDGGREEREARRHSHSRKDNILLFVVPPTY